MTVIGRDGLASRRLARSRWLVSCGPVIRRLGMASRTCQSPEFRENFWDRYVMHVRAGEIAPIDIVCEPGTPLDPCLHPRDGSGD